MPLSDIPKILKLLKRQQPIMLGSMRKRTPFEILISTVLSARTKDTTTIRVARNLFKKYNTPEQLSKILIKKLESEIRGVGFYRQKAKYIKKLSGILIEKYQSKVPSDFSDLISLPGVGRKTANCVLVYAFRKPAIPVDTHVHRISNRLGLIRTKTPKQSEISLMKIIPRKHWIEINELFVKHGQTICTPISPFCSRCKIRKYCKRIGVVRSR